MILVVGGLLSAHLLSYRLYLDPKSNELDVSGKLDPEWPCNGPLLRLAVNAANKLLPGRFLTMSSFIYYLEF